jgi:hypothetical protein
MTAAQLKTEHLKLFSLCYGHAVVQLVKALRYKPEGREIES